MTAVPAQHETPETICQWATETFGDGGSGRYVAWEEDDHLFEHGPPHGQHVEGT